MYNAAKFESPGIADDQAEGGCHVLCLSHSGKWIPLAGVVSVSYNKRLIHKVTQSEMQNCWWGSLQGCAGAIRISLPAPWWVPLSPEDSATATINLPVNMDDSGWGFTQKQKLEFGASMRKRQTNIWAIKEDNPEQPNREKCVRFS